MSLPNREFAPVFFMPGLALPIRLEDTGTAEEVVGKICGGSALLQVVSTPWGVEFSLCEVTGK